MTAYYRDRFDQIIRSEDGASIPIDEENEDYKEFLKWVGEGNALSGQTTPTPKIYDWNGLAIAFKTSRLNDILNYLKDTSQNPQVNVIWRLSDDISQITTLNVFPDEIRLGALERDLFKLFETFRVGKVPIPQAALDEIVQAIQNIQGFEGLADRLKEVELYVE
jgi:hypothetical protein